MGSTRVIMVQRTRKGPGLFPQLSTQLAVGSRYSVSALPMTLLRLHSSCFPGDRLQKQIALMGLQFSEATENSTTIYRYNNS